MSAPSPGGPHRALVDVLHEVTRQRAIWGQQDHEPSRWALILGEEVGEVSRAALEVYSDESGGEAIANLRAELVQVAAVAVSWIQSLDRGVPVPLGLAETASRPDDSRPPEERHARELEAALRALAVDGEHAREIEKALRVLGDDGAHEAWVGALRVLGGIDRARAAEELPF